MANGCYKRPSEYLPKGVRGYRARDYKFARDMARPHVGRGYEVAEHFAKLIASRSRTSRDFDFVTAFREHVAIWKNETGHLSSVTKAIAHPSYLRIIGLSGCSSNHALERLLLSELDHDPDHWFAALVAITGQDPVKPEHDFDEAIGAWLEWGRQKGIY
jgi:hypothetical protein